MRLLLVEDDEVIARELLLRWRSRGWTVVVCHSLQGAGQAFARMSADQGLEILVLDLGMPDGDGLAWLEELRQHDRLTPVIILTARDRVADRVAGLKGGADDYLVKPFDPEELDARIEALQRRGGRNRSVALRYGPIAWIREEGSAYVDSQRLDLMPREFEVLGLLISRAPRMLAKRALVDALAERNLDVGDGAAEVYVSRLRRKLANSGTTIRTLRGFGYVLELVDSSHPA